jgi:hypothetical protein
MAMTARQTSVEYALNEFAWLGALQIALKLHQTSIEGLTQDLLQNPQQHGAIGPGVRVLSGHAKFAADTPPSGYRNKTAMIYLVSVLETFLRDVCKKCMSPPIDVEGAMFGALLGRISRSGKITGFEQAPEVECVNLVRLIRNVIVHCHGEVPPDFWVNPNRAHDSAENYIHAWPGDQGEFRRYYQPSNKVWLHIDKVVVRSVFCAMDFIRYMDRELQALGVP